MANENEPTVTLSADVAPFEQSLNKAAAALDAWGKRLEQKMQQASQVLAKESERQSQSIKKTADELIGKFDKITNLVGFGLQGAIAGLGLEAGKQFLELATQTEKWAKALERAGELAEKLNKTRDRADARASARLEASSATPGARLAELERQLRDAEFERRAAERQKQEAERERTNAEFWGPSVGDSPGERLQNKAGLLQQYLGRGLSSRQEELDAKLKQATEQYESRVDRARQLEEKIKEAQDPLKDLSKIKEVEELTEALGRQAEALGLSADAAKLRELELRGFGELQVRQVKDAQELLKGFEAFRDAGAGMGDFLNRFEDKSKEIDAVTAAIQKQADTWGMSADQLQIYELKLKGFGKDAIESVEKAQRERNISLIGMGIAAGFMAGPPEAKSRDIAATQGVNALMGGQADTLNMINAINRATTDAQNPQVIANKLLEAGNKVAADNGAKLNAVAQSVDRMRDEFERIQTT